LRDGLFAGRSPLIWSLVRVSDGAILQSGSTASVNKLVSVRNVTVFKDPVRCRLEVRVTARSAN